MSRASCDFCGGDLTIASTEVSHRLTDGAMRVSVFGLAAYYGVPVELVAEMRDAAACPSSWQPAGEEVLP